jgi:hypothetical protein
MEPKTSLLCSLVLIQITFQIEGNSNRTLCIPVSGRKPNQAIHVRNTELRITSPERTLLLKSFRSFLLSGKMREGPAPILSL